VCSVPYVIGNFVDCGAGALAPAAIPPAWLHRKASGGARARADNPERLRPAFSWARERCRLADLDKSPTADVPGASGVRHFGYSKWSTINGLSSVAVPLERFASVSQVGCSLSRLRGDQTVSFQIISLI
jgi:hypothetical protein